MYLEAYAAGLPVVAGDSGGAPEAVIPGKTGGLVAAGKSVEATEAAVCYLLEDAERAKAMGQAGKEWVDQAWRWSNLVKPLLKELNEGLIPTPGLRQFLGNYSGFASGLGFGAAVTSLVIERAVRRGSAVTLVTLTKGVPLTWGVPDCRKRPRRQT